MLPLGWVTAGGSDALWGMDLATYRSIPHDKLPPVLLEGRPFAWLETAPDAEWGLAFDGGYDSSVKDGLGELSRQASKEGLIVPDDFIGFMTNPILHTRVPTCTACYLELPSKLFALPDGEPGRLLRFMNDQQCCVLWFLHLQPNGRHSVVCAAPEFSDSAEEGASMEDAMKLHEPMTCAPSFESFMRRFWLENSIWFAAQNQTKLTPEQEAYSRAAKKSWT